MSQREIHVHVAVAQRRARITLWSTHVARAPERARHTRGGVSRGTATQESAAGSGVRSAPRSALHRPCEYLLTVTHALPTAHCDRRQGAAPAQPARSGCGIATARRSTCGAGAAAPSTSKHALSHTTRAIRSAAWPSHRSITGRVGERRASARSAAARTGSRRGITVDGRELHEVRAGADDGQNAHRVNDEAVWR